LSRNDPLGTIEHLETDAKVSGKAMVAALSAVQLKAEGIKFTDDNGVLDIRLHPQAMSEVETVRPQVPTHRFHPGQTFEFNPPHGIYAPRGTCVVTAKSPEKDGGVRISQ
jgi:hypothetical protein